MSKFRKIRILLVFIFLFFSLSVFALEIKCIKVIDGDTILLSNGERLRYIGIDTPETKHPLRKVEYLGREAYLLNKKLVEGKNIRIEFDVEKRDRYGRLLGYVYVGDIFVNAYLVKNGYAQVYTVPPNVKYSEFFLKLQKEARENKRGLWKREEEKKETTSSSYYVASKIREPFHYPWCKWAKKIKKENLQIFKTREEAIEAGHRPCKFCNP
jgi:micrococcal nuclease